DRPPRHPLRRAVSLRLWPRCRERRIRGVPDSDGRSAAALCRGRAADPQGIARARIRVAGEFYQIPRTSIPPRPISHPEKRSFASSISPESAEIMAKLGFGILVVMQNEWPKAAESIVNYREIAASVGYDPPPPIILTNVSCAESRAEAQDRAMNWLGKK